MSLGVWVGLQVLTACLQSCHERVISALWHKACLPPAHHRRLEFAASRITAVTGCKKEWHVFSCRVGSKRNKLPHGALLLLLMMLMLMLQQ